MKTKIEKIKALELPKSQEYWDDISYSGGTRKELSRIENMLSFEIYENNSDFYLLVWVNNWYQKGPLDVSQTISQHRICFQWENENWKEIDIVVFYTNYFSNALIWSINDITDLNDIKIDEV